MNRKIALSLLSIFTALTLAGSSAFGAFATSADLKSNTFSTTNPNLQVSLTNTDDYTSQLTPGFTETGIVPGGSVTDHAFYLKNFDTDSTGTLALTGQFTVTGGSGSYLDDLSVTITCNDGTTITTVTKSVTDWKNSAQGLGNLAPSTVDTCKMSASLPSGNTTDAGQSVTFDAVFNGSVGS